MIEVCSIQATAISNAKIHSSYGKVTCTVPHGLVQVLPITVPKKIHIAIVIKIPCSHIHLV